MAWSAAPEITTRLRAALPADAPCLSVLGMQVFLDTYATDGIRAAIAREVHATFGVEAMARDLAAPEARLIVAERADHLVGYAHLVLGTRHPLVPAKRPAELLRLYVQQAFVGQGIGSRLLNASEQQAGALGTDRLWLTHWVHNQRARAFYLRRGYADQGMTDFVFEGESHQNRVMARWL